MNLNLDIETSNSLLKGIISGLSIYGGMRLIYDGYSWWFGSTKLSDLAFKAIRNTDIVKDEFDKVRRKLRVSFEKEHLAKYDKNLTLPTMGMSYEQLMEMFKNWVACEEPTWQSGKVSGAVYHGGEEHLKFLAKVATLYSITNPLHPDVWPSLRKMDAEIVAMTASLVAERSESKSNQKSKPVGVVTTGGTESIILSCWAHRQFYEEKYGIREPVMIVPISGHPAFEKAARLLKITLVKVPVGADYAADVKEIGQSLERYAGRVIMVVASAPSFPHGIMDPIKEIATLAKKAGVGCHVDACLGGFIIPFIAAEDDSGLTQLQFIDGVTAMSLDTHKFGYALKGSSVVLYANEELRRAQYFTFPDWSGGLYATSNLTGSRVGSVTAACWASMMSLGYEGYAKAANQIMIAASKLKHGIETQFGDHLKIIGDPQLMVIAFTTKETERPKHFNIYDLNDALSKKGWHLNVLQNPAALHFCITLRQVDRIEEFLQCLGEVISTLRKNQQNRGSNDNDGMAPIYGTLAKLPNLAVDDSMKMFLDETWHI